MPTTQTGSYPSSGILTSTLITQYDAFKPQHIAQLSDRFEDQFVPMFTWLQAMGREESVKDETWFGHEENWHHKTISVLTATPVNGVPGGDPGAGNVTNVVLDPADHDAAGRSYPRVGDHITIPGTNVQCRVHLKTVTNPAAHVIQLMPLRTTDNIGSILPGTVLSITSGSFGNGTGQPDGTVVGTTRRTFNAQIFKETLGAEGAALIKEMWYEMANGWYSPALDRVAGILALKIDGAFTNGVETNNPAMVVPAGEPGAGNAIRTTKGLFPWASEEGRTIPVVAGNFDIETVKQIENYLLSQGIASGNALAMVGVGLGQDIGEAAFNLIDGNGTDFTKAANAVFGDSGLALDLKFRSLRLSNNMALLLKSMPVWSHPQCLGATGYDWNQRGIIAPLTTVKDPTTGSYMKNLAVRYLSNYGYNRRMEIWRIGAAGGQGASNYVDAIDATHTYMRSHQGLQVLKANQLVVLEP